MLDRFSINYLYDCFSKIPPPRIHLNIHFTIYTGKIQGKKWKIVVQKEVQGTETKV